jgi:hypothetical protein
MYFNFWSNSLTLCMAGLYGAFNWRQEGNLTIRITCLDDVLEDVAFGASSVDLSNSFSCTFLLLHHL